MKNYRDTTCQKMILRIFMSTLFITLLTFAVLPKDINAASSRSSKSTQTTTISAEAISYFKKGEKYQDQKNYRAAAREYKKAIKTAPRYAEAYSNLGYTLRKQKAHKEAIKHYKKAIAIDYNLAEAHEYLGEAYAELGKIKLAERELAILRKLGSDEADELEKFIQKKKGSY